MNNMKQRFLRTFVIGAVLLLGNIFLINMIFDNLNPWRIDLTKEKVYKLSPSVKKILNQLEAPIEITYYVSSSEKMPTQWKNLERDVIDKLKELELASRGMLTYKVFDPSAEEEKEAFEEKQQQKTAESDEDQEKSKIGQKKIAEKLYEKGVIPFGVQSAQQDEFAIKRVYSSIVLSYLDRKEEIIEEVRPETFGQLEYAIMSRIYKLISNKRPKIGFYPSNPEIPPQMRQYYRQQTPPDMYDATAQMLREQGYDVIRTNIKADDPIPENIQTMVIMADQPLNERQLYEIDKLVHNGVRLIVAGNMYNYQVSPARNIPGEFDLRGMPTQVNLNDLVKSYGFELDSKMFMDKSTTYIQVPVYKTTTRGIFQVREQRMEPVTKPVMIRVNAQNINNHLSIANGVSDLFYIYGTRLLINEEKMKQDTLHYKTLFTSSDFSWTREGSSYGLIDENPPAEENVVKNQPLGIYVEGRFKSKYVDINIPGWPTEPGEEETEEQPTLPSEITGQGQENKIIAIGNSMMFQSHILPNVTSHKALLINCVDALTLGDELIDIRSKNLVIRRIDDTSLNTKAWAKFYVIWQWLLLIPIIGWMINRVRTHKLQLWHILLWVIWCYVFQALLILQLIFGLPWLIILWVVWMNILIVTEALLKSFDFIRKYNLQTWRIAFWISWGIVFQTLLILQIIFGWPWLIILWVVWMNILILTEYLVRTYNFIKEYKSKGWIIIGWRILWFIIFQVLLFIQIAYGAYWQIIFPMFWIIVLILSEYLWRSLKFFGYILKHRPILEKEVYFIGIAFVVLFNICFFTIDRPKGINFDELVQNVVFGFSNEDVNHIEIYKQAEGGLAQIKFSKIDNEWRIPTYFNAKGSKTKIDKLLTDIIEMTGNVRSSDPKHLETYQITDDKGIHLILKDVAEKPLANLIIGKRSEDSNSGFVRFSDKDKVYAVDKNLLSSLSIYGDVDTVTIMKQSTWVELQAVDKNQDDYAEVALVSGKKSVHIRKVDRTRMETVGDSSVTRQVKEWALVKGNREVDLEQKSVNDFFRDAGKIRGTEVVDQIANSFMEMNKITKYGFDRADHYLVFLKPDGTRENVLFGKEYEKDKGYYMQTQEDGLVYKVAKYNFDKVVKWVEDLPKNTK